MKALVFKDVGEIALEDVKEPSLQDSYDVIVRLTTSAICGTDLHMIRGTLAGMQKGTILGHEGVGIIEQVGADVRHFKVKDRVIIPSTICCGNCDYCAQEIFSQCDHANPNGPDAGTAFYGGPKTTGPFAGMQAEKVRVPFADACLIKIPAHLTDDQVILLSDILPTSYMAVEQAQVTPNDTVAVFGCGPVGQMAIACLKKIGVKQIFAIDHIPCRLQMAENQGAIPIHFDKEEPVTTLRKATSGKGPTKIIDAVGVDAQQAHLCGLAYITSLFVPTNSHFKEELKEVAPVTSPHDGNWQPGSGPSQVLQWAVLAIAKAGTLSIIGVYPPTMRFFPIGIAMNKNITIRMGNCNHRKYIPHLLKWVENGTFDTRPFITHHLALNDIINAYQQFDIRQDNWIKVILSV